MKRTRFATDKGGGLCGNRDGLKSGKNLSANFAITFGTTAIECVLLLSASVPAIVLLDLCSLALSEVGSEDGSAEELKLSKGNKHSLSTIILG